MSLLNEADFVTRPVSVAPEDLVLIKNHLEASEGLGFLVAKRGGDALLVCHRSRTAELDEFITDLKLEVSLRTVRLSTHDEAWDVAR